MDSKKQKPDTETERDRQRETQYEQHQQYSKHTCVVYSISNEQFTELSPGTTQSFKFIQHCIFILPLTLLTLTLMPLHYAYPKSQSVCYT